jgi:hypothetical protein
MPWMFVCLFICLFVCLFVCLFFGFGGGSADRVGRTLITKKKKKKKKKKAHVSRSLTDATASWELVHSYPAHSSRATALVTCGATGRAFSVGRDKALTIYTRASRDFRARKISNAWLSSLAHDPKANVCFVGSYAQTILIVSVAAEMPQVVGELTGGHTGSVRLRGYGWFGVLGFLHRI